MATLLGLGALLLVLVGLVGLYVSRQRTLSRRVASFSCLLNPGPAAEGQWLPGIAQFARDRLLWWRTVSLSPRPARMWLRAELTLVDRVPLGQQDEEGRPLLVVSCRNGEESFQLMISAAACAGLVSWLESGPRRGRRVV